MRKIMKRMKDLKKVDKDLLELYSLYVDSYFSVKSITLFILLAPVLLSIIGILSTFLEDEKTLTNIIILIVLLSSYVFALIGFYKKFKKQIKDFFNSIFYVIHFEKYTSNGKALLPEDFENIKNEDNVLYHYVTTDKCRGFCYSICFEILKVLKEGEIRFMAVKKTESENDEEGSKDNEFTMHVIYVKNNWGFDTFSWRQYPVEKLIHCFKAKEYKSFSYQDVKDKEYEDFRKEQYPDLKKWCEENDCYQIWIKEE